MIKRFIAGAICPQCGAQDTIRMHQTATSNERECVRCQFQDSLPLEEVNELPTRVARAKQPAKTDAQPIKFYPRNK